MAAIQKLARIVNKSAEGEPEHAVLQIIQTNKIFEFSEVKFIYEGESGKTIMLSERMNDNDLTQPIIRRILNQNHTVMLSYYEPNDDVTLLFV